MKLPGIEYGAPVQSTAEAARAPFNAADRLASVIEQGLQAYGQALVKTEQDAAKATLAEELNKAENAIKATKEWSQEDVKSILGDQLPPEVQKRIGILDEATGKPVPIPSWAVGEAFFGKAAENAVRKASSSITVGDGWVADFQEQARVAVAARAQGLAEHHLRGLDAYLQTTQLQNIERKRNAGDFDGADTTVMNALPLEVQQAERAKTEVARRLKGPLDALASDDPAEIKRQMDALKADPAILASVPEATRRQVGAHLEDRWVKHEGSRVSGEAFAAGFEPGSRAFNEKASRTALDARLKGLSPEVEKEARALYKGRLNEFEEERKNETSQVFAGAQQAFNAPGPLQFKTAGIPVEYRNYLRNPANGKYASDLWASLLRDEKTAESGARSLAAQPTEANYAAYSSLVKDMEDNPTKYRAMSGERFTAEVYGKVGPLISLAMSAYKGAVEAPPMDSRVLVASERTALRESLPPQYRPSNTTEPSSAAGRLWAQMEEKIAARKEREWADEKGPVPQGVLKEWVAEEWKKGTVKGGAWYQFDKTGVPKAVADAKYPDRTWVPDEPPQAGYPLAAPAAPPPATPPAPPAAPAAAPAGKPAIGTRVPGEAIGRSGGEYERVQGGWKRVN